VSATATLTMRAGVVRGPGSTRTEHVALPEPGPGQVRVRLEGCGVCGSNLPLWEGRPWFSYPTPPGAPGHEGWGYIDALGFGTGEFTLGERVALLSERAFAEYDLAEASAILPLPSTLADQPFPGEPLGCAMNVFRRSDIRPDQTVVVIGVGFLGAVIVQLAAGAGARVIALSRRGFALDVAREMGAEHTVTMDDHGRVLAEVRKLTAGAGAERVIEAVGMQWPLDLAGELTRERGRLVIAGYHQDGPRQVNLQLWNWRGLDVVNAHERDPLVYKEGMRLAMEAVVAGRLDPTRLYTHTFTLDQLGEALDTMRERPDGFLKALVVT
jgi:threonine dehydrogenase-like Zn-dependent dehydrogenase